MELVKEGEKKPRTLMDINNEYTKACFIYGDREYKMRHMRAEMEAAVVSMKILDAEAQVLSKARKEAPPAEQEEPIVAPPEPVNQ